MIAKTIFIIVAVAVTAILALVAYEIRHALTLPEGEQGASYWEDIKDNPDNDTEEDKR